MSTGLNDETKLFLSEMAELLDVLEDALLTLEKSPEPDVIAEAFRAAHTLKGSSATIGFAGMSSLTHAMEDMLDSWREGAPVTPEGVALLLEGLDWLSEAKKAIEAGKGCPEPGALVERMRNGPSGDRALDLRQSRQDSDAAPWASAGAEVEEAVAKGLRVFRIQVDFDRYAPMPSVRAFQVLMALEEVGRIPWSDPSEEAIEKDEVSTHLDVLLITDGESEEISRALSRIPELDNTRITEIKVQPQRKTPTGQPSKGRVLGSSVRLDVELLDNLMNLVGELIVDRTRLAQVVNTMEASPDLEDIEKNLVAISSHIGRISTQLQEGIMRARLVPLQSLVRKYPRMVRDLAVASGKEVEMIIEGEQTELDRSVIEAIDDPLIHILRNAVDHGIEPPEERVALGKPRKGTVRLSAAHRENQVIITVKDDGRGIDAERLRESAVRKGLVPEEVAKRLADEQALDLIFLPGFSTKEQVSEVSGRGVGMDVVRTNLKRINGSVEVRTQVGKGTCFRLRLPLTLAIIQALLVQAGESTYALPLSLVSEVVKVEPENVKTVKGKPVISVRDRIFPLVDLQSLFFKDGLRPRHDGYAVITVDFGAQVAIGVDGLMGQQEIVVKNLGKFFGSVKGISGATILGDGDLALIVDITMLVGTQATDSLEKFREAS